MTQGFLRGKTSKRKHTRVDTTTTGKAIHYMKMTYTLKLSTYDIRSSYHLLVYPMASELPSLLPIQDVSYTSRKQLSIQDAHVSRKIFYLPIRILPTLDKSPCLIIRVLPTLIKTSLLYPQSFTHFARDFNIMQGYDLHDANDANTIKLS